MTDDTLRAALLTEHDRLRDEHGESHDCDECMTVQRLTDAALAASATDEALDVSAAALRLALRSEMGWSVHEVEDFLSQYNLTKPLDEYDPQRLDGEYAALAASAPELDVERLIRSEARIRQHLREANPGFGMFADTPMEHATALAREYAALKEPTE